MWKHPWESDRDEEDEPAPGEPPRLEDTAPIDHAPVPPLTEADDTEGG